MPRSPDRRASVETRFAGPGDSEGMIPACYGPGVSREQPRPFDKSVSCRPKEHARVPPGPGVTGVTWRSSVGLAWV